HWLAYRAVVRAKVAAIRHSESARAADVDEARVLLGMAHRHLQRGEVRLVLVGGLPGSGKSTLAAGVAGATGWSLLRSDALRKEDGSPPSYLPRDRAAIYAEMLGRSEA